MVLRKLHSLFPQIARYGIVGAIVYGVDFLTFTLLLYLLTDQYLWANFAAKLAGALTGFLLHRNFTFKGAHKYGPARQFASYSLLLGSNILVVNALLYLGVEQLQLPETIAKVASDVIVIAISFIISRMFIFKQSDSLDE